MKTGRLSNPVGGSQSDQLELRLVTLTKVPGIESAMLLTTVGGSERGVRKNGHLFYRLGAYTSGYVITF